MNERSQLFGIPIDDGAQTTHGTQLTTATIELSFLSVFNELQQHINNQQIH